MAEHLNQIAFRSEQLLKGEEDPSSIPAPFQECFSLTGNEVAQKQREPANFKDFWSQYTLALLERQCKYHGTEVAFMLPTQPPQVRFSHLTAGVKLSPKSISLRICHSNFFVSAYWEKKLEKMS